MRELLALSAAWLAWAPRHPLALENNLSNSHQKPKPQKPNPYKPETPMRGNWKREYTIETVLDALRREMLGARAIFESL